jgi:serine/threonine protein kinase
MTEGVNVITGQKVAIKILNKKKTKQMGIFDKLKREIKILKNTFMHPNIIKIYDYIDTSSELYIIMEIAVGGELFDYITQKDKVSSNFFIDIFISYQNRNAENFFCNWSLPSNIVTQTTSAIVT